MGTISGGHWFVTLLILAFCGALVGWLAKRKGRNPIGWGLFGAIIPIIAIIAVLIVKPVRQA